MKNFIFLRRKDHAISCSPGQTFEMGILQLEKVAFEGVTESKQICIICKTQGRNTRRGGVDSFMQFRDVKQEKNRGERRALRNTTMNGNRRRFRVIKNKSSRAIGAEGVDPGGEPKRYTFSFQDLLKDLRKNSVIGSRNVQRKKGCNYAYLPNLFHLGCEEEQCYFC